MSKGYRVYPFTFDDFCRALAREPNASPQWNRPLAEDVARHHHAQKLFGYLDKQIPKPRTIVVETMYVDRDYLGDYTTFYATVYARFDRFCKRVHFFTEEFEERTFEAQIIGEGRSAEDFARSYVGFTVVRPLPEAIIGRTVLRAYPENVRDGARRYNAVVDTRVNLYGIDLSICDSLPFQQQDSVIAACATVSLWSAFAATSKLFGTDVPRAAEITRSATSGKFQERVFPTAGLTLEQICTAVRANQLEPEVFTLDDPAVPILSWIRAYLEMGLPALMLVKLPDGRDHSVTIAGYRCSNSVIHEREGVGEQHEAPSAGRRIVTLYCHDDNICPFARYQIAKRDDGTIVFNVDEYAALGNGETSTVEIGNIVVPIYHKIRLGFASIQGWVTVLDSLLPEILNPSVSGRREWDVRLLRNEQLKNEVRSLPLARSIKHDLLAEAQPRFIWCVVLRAAPGVELLRLHLDATGFARSMPLRRAVIYDEKLLDGLLKLLPALFGRPGLGETARRLHDVISEQALRNTPDSQLPDAG
ncbi:MAG TPA: hypothetical protein VHS78_14480 [Candidatus Elarobacter sp.]|nr:hypothetical protein [Candidatus Elarobacter sp.]